MRFFLVVLVLMSFQAQAERARPAPPPPRPTAVPAKPPAPAVLATQPAPAAPRPTLIQPPPIFVPQGIEGLPGGLWRLRFAAGEETPPAQAMPGLALIGRRLAQVPEGRITILAQASGPVADVSTARRMTLARGLAVKEALVNGGLPETRIDVRPMGRLPEPLDVVDIQPPAVAAPK